MSTHLDLCRRVLELILGFKIRKVELSEAQRSIDVALDAKGVRLDVYVDDGEDTVYNIEMQTTGQKFIAKRSRYYQGMIDVGILEKGKGYSSLKRCFVIFLCLQDPFDDGKAVYRFENREETTFKSMGDEAYKVFLNAGYDEAEEKSLPSDMKAFLRFLADGTAESDLTRDIREEVAKAVDQSEWRREYMLLWEREELAREAGREEGRAEGRAEGRVEGRAEIVSALLDQGKTVEEISNLCRIPLEEVLKVQEELLQTV